jgi:hypothetical protein
MAIVSYRLYCQGDNCSNEEVIREDRMEQSQWKIITLHYHEGMCPACNPSVAPEDEEYRRCHEEVAFEELDNIGESGADNLREKGIVTRQDVADASDEEILETAWVGDKGLKSIRRSVQE